MDRRVFIVHGWDSSPEDAWIPWIRNELTSRGLEVIVPAMPNPLAPVIDEWVGYLSDVVGDIRETDIFVGHSVGSQAVLRYLERIPERHITGIVSVAGWFTLRGLETELEELIAKPWLETPINFDVVRRVADRIIAILSDDDPYVELASTTRIFEERLGGLVIVERAMGHFSIEHGGVRELPILRDIILTLTS